LNEDTCNPEKGGKKKNKKGKRAPISKMLRQWGEIRKTVSLRGYPSPQLSQKKKEGGVARTARGNQTLFIKKTGEVITGDYSQKTFMVRRRREANRSLSGWQGGGKG